MRLISHRSVAVCIGGAAVAMAVCGAILNYGAAKVMSPGEAATTLAWAAAISEAIKHPGWRGSASVCDGAKFSPPRRCSVSACFCTATP